MSPWQLGCVRDGHRNLCLKFGQNRASNSWDIADIEFPVGGGGGGWWWWWWWWWCQCCSERPLMIFIHTWDDVVNTRQTSSFSGSPRWMDCVHRGIFQSPVSVSFEVEEREIEKGKIWIREWNAPPVSTSLRRSHRSVSRNVRKWLFWYFYRRSGNTRWGGTQIRSGTLTSCVWVVSYNPYA